MSKKDVLIEDVVTARQSMVFAGVLFFLLMARMLFTYTKESIQAPYFYIEAFALLTLGGFLYWVVKKYNELQEKLELEP